MGGNFRERGLLATSLRREMQSPIFLRKGEESHDLIGTGKKDLPRINVGLLTAVRGASQRRANPKRRSVSRRAFKEEETRCISNTRGDCGTFGRSSGGVPRLHTHVSKKGDRSRWQARED